MIQLIDVTKTYKVKNGPEVKALDHVNITFGERGLVFILGKSGAGKSTLLNVVGGLDRIDSGDIVIMGKSSKDFTQAEFDSYRNTYLGFIFQEYNILPDFTIGQNIALALQLQGQKGTNEEVDAILDQVDLHGLRERKPNELSGGQKQRVAIARALIKKPQIIMADEPTGALDSKTGQDIFNTLKKLAQDHLVICVSHDRDFAESFGDRVIEMRDGQVLSDITKSYVDTVTSTNGTQILSPRLLSFPVGHVLTEEDIKLLNNYLAQAKRETLVSTDEAINTSIKTSAKIEEGGKKGTFSETTPEMVGAKDYTEPDFKLKKSRLPFLRSLKIAANSLRSKPFRLVVTSILVMASLVLFGVAATLASYNPRVAFVGCFKDFDVQAVAFSRYTATKVPGESYYDITNNKFSENDIKAVAAETGMNFIPFASRNELLMQSSDGSSLTYTFSQSNGRDYSSGSDSTTNLYSFALESRYYLESSAATLTKDYGATLAAGVYPTADDEVAVTDYFYEFVRRYGYSYYVDASSQTNIHKEEAQTIPDFLAKKPSLSYLKYSDSGNVLKSLKIVGVVKTNIDLSFFKVLDTAETNLDQSSNSVASKWYNYLNSSLVSVFYGTSNLHETMRSWINDTLTPDTPFYSLCRARMAVTDDNVNKFYDYCNSKKCFETERTEGIHFSLSDCSNPKNSKDSSFFGSFGATTAFAYINSFVMNFKTPFFYVGLGTAVFAALLLATFIASSISYQKRKIGILRAIGARGTDIYGIFWDESMLITLGSALIAIIITVVVDAALSNAINKALGFVLTVFQFSIWVFLLILGLAVLTATISSFVPCLIISKKKPIDSINDK
jgi:ABC-type lipoprotein export system ATPase subunit/ABC-type antimicrobial peptide transport system permease subunit